MSAIRGFAFPVVAGLGLFIALLGWAFSSPVGSAPDDTYHLPTVWCSWGEHESCVRDGQGSFQAPQMVTEICTYQRPQVSAACEYLRSDEPMTVGHLQYVGSDTVLQGNDVFHRVLRVFVGPDAQQSALNMRVFNAALASLLFSAALIVSGAGARRALALSWLVASVPVGMFIMSSTNPSSWAIMGVGTYWAFLLAAVRCRTWDWRRWTAVGGTVASAAIAVGGRTDVLVFIAGSTLAVALIAWPRIRRNKALLIGLGVLAAAVAVLIVATSVRDRILIVLRGIGSSEGADPRLVESGVNPTVNHLLELPSFLWAMVGGQPPTFGFPTAYQWGLGWLDTSVPSVTGVLMLLALGIVIAWGLGGYNVRKVLAVVMALLTLVGAILLPLEGVNYAPTFVTQPRYYLPMLFVVIATVALRPVHNSRPRLALIALLVSSVVLANAAAHLASLHRYTNGELLPWTRFDLEPSWWWLGSPVGPNVLWGVGVIGFTVFAVAVGLISRDGVGSQRGVAAK